MAPEVTRHEPYDEKCDVYSYGCLAYEMTSYCVPFQHMTTLEAAFAVASMHMRVYVYVHGSMYMHMGLCICT